MFSIINIVVILGSWISSTVNFIASSENSKNNDDRSYRRSYVWEVWTCQNQKGQCSSGLQCHSVGAGTWEVVVAILLSSSPFPYSIAFQYVICQALECPWVVWLCGMLENLASRSSVSFQHFLCSPCCLTPAPALILAGEQGYKIQLLFLCT